MVDRQWVGDLSLAVLLAMPLAALAWPQPSVPQHGFAPAAAKVAVADRVPGNGRISLLG